MKLELKKSELKTVKLKKQEKQHHAIQGPQNIKNIGLYLRGKQQEAEREFAFNPIHGTGYGTQSENPAKCAIGKK